MDIKDSMWYCGIIAVEETSIVTGKNKAVAVVSTVP